MLCTHHPMYFLHWKVPSEVSVLLLIFWWWVVIEESKFIYIGIVVFHTFWFYLQSGHENSGDAKRVATRAQDIQEILDATLKDDDESRLPPRVATTIDNIRRLNMIVCYWLSDQLILSLNIAALPQSCMTRRRLFGRRGYGIEHSTRRNIAPSSHPRRTS